MRLFALLVVMTIVSACHPPSSPEPRQAPAPQAQETANEAVEYAWMPASDSAKFLEIEEQLQGYSRTMREVHYRYKELYWAGQDENWEYADYQLEHIVEAIEQGNTRRPKYATLGKAFLERDVPPMQEAIDQKSAELFAARFEAFTGACNTCHGLAEHGFIKVGAPKVRYSAVGVD
jgi:mono/diheme cytochrome c family protein